MIYLVIGISVIVGFWMLLDLLSDHEPAPGSLSRVLHDRRFKKSEQRQ